MSFRMKETPHDSSTKQNSNSSSNKHNSNNSSDNRKSTHTLYQLLVTTNDSRIRLCDLTDYSLTTKFKGLKNKSMQIKATFSENQTHIICGSEDGKAHIWDTTVKPTSKLSLFGSKCNRNSSFEQFSCTSGDDVPTTAALFAPTATVHCVLKYNDRDKQNTDKKNNTAADLTTNNNIATTGAQPNTNDNVKRHRNSTFVDNLDLCTRMIVTADYQGVVRCFLRVNSD